MSVALSCGTNQFLHFHALSCGKSLKLASNVLLAHVAMLGIVFAFEIAKLVTEGFNQMYSNKLCLAGSLLPVRAKVFVS